MEKFGNPVLDAGSDDDTIEIDEDDYYHDSQPFNDLIRKVVLERMYVTDTVADTVDSDCEGVEEDDEQRLEETYTPRLGERVSTSYTPASQRYIDHYNSQAFTGEVFFVDEESDNFFMWNVETGPMCDGQISLSYRVQSFKREGCHFFGMSDCYYGTFEYV